MLHYFILLFIFCFARCVVFCVMIFMLVCAMFCFVMTISVCYGYFCFYMEGKTEMMEERRERKGEINRKGGN